MCIFLAISSCAEKQTVESLLAKAIKYQAENKLKESEIELKNAIQLDMTNAEVRFVLGRLYLSQGAGLNAVKELEKALSLKFEQRKLLPLLARAYLISDDYEGVLALAEKAKTIPVEAKVEFLSYQTLAAIRTKQIDIAIASVKEANDLIAGNPHTVLANAYLALVENRTAQAEALVAKSLSIGASNPEAMMLQGQIFSILGEFEEAVESFKKYATLQPQSKVIYLVLAETLLKTENYLEAEKYADMILNALPNQPVANYVKAMVRFSEKDYAAASEFAEKAILTNYNTPQLRLVAGASAFYLNNFEQVNLHLAPIVNKLVSDHPARKMFAVSLFQLGLIDDITETLGDFTPITEADEQFMSSLSFNLYSIGAKKEALSLVSKIAKKQNTNSSSNTRQGILKLMMNDPSGIENLEQAIVLNPNMLEAELALAYVAIQSGDYEKALSVASKWKEKRPEKAGGYNMLAAIYIRQGNIDDAKKMLQISLEKEIGNLFAVTEMTKLLYQAGDHDGAKRYANNAIQLFPSNAKALKYYYAVYKTPEALTKISTVYLTNKESIELKLLYMEVLFASKDYKKVIELSTKAPDTIKTPKKLWKLRLLAYKQLQQDEQIKLTLNEWLKINPYHVEPVLLSADLYSKIGEQQRSLSIINKALDKHHKDNLILKLIKMQLLLDSRLVDQAKVLLKQLENENFDETVKVGLNGRIALLEGKYSQAVPSLDAFYKKFQSSKNAVLLALALQESGKKPQAIKLLESHLDKQENDQQVRNLLANLYIENDRNQAFNQYQSLVKAQPSNVVALNNLAWLSMEKGKHQDALTYSEKAYKLAPQVANVVDTYGQILLKLNKNREALTKSKEAYELSETKDVDITLNHIETLIANSRTNEAKILLEQLEPATKAQRIRKSQLAMH